MKSSTVNLNLRGPAARLGGWVLAVLALGAGALQAQTVATFSGTITSIYAPGSTDFASAGIAVGTPFSFTVTYAGSPSFTGSYGAGHGRYDFSTNATLSATIGSNSLVFSVPATGGNPLVVTVYDDWDSYGNGSDVRDGFQFGMSAPSLGQSFTTQHGFDVNFLGAELSDQSHDAFSSGSSLSVLTAGSYPLGDFNIHTLQLTVANGDVVGASVTSYSISAVPEPSTYAAIAGAAMLGYAAWRRKRGGI